MKIWAGFATVRSPSCVLPRSPPSRSLPSRRRTAQFGASAVAACRDGDPRTRLCRHVQREHGPDGGPCKAAARFLRGVGPRPRRERTNIASSQWLAARSLARRASRPDETETGGARGRRPVRGVRRHPQDEHAGAMGEDPDRRHGSGSDRLRPAGDLPRRHRRILAPGGKFRRRRNRRAFAGAGRAKRRRPNSPFSISNCRIPAAAPESSPKAPRMPSN